jgi:hypothetical protein
MIFFLKITLFNCLVFYKFFYSMVHEQFMRYNIFRYYKFVVVLTLGSQPKQGLTRMRAKREARESHLMLPGMQKSVRE